MIDTMLEILSRILIFMVAYIGCRDVLVGVDIPDMPGEGSGDDEVIQVDLSMIPDHVEQTLGEDG